MTLPVLPVCVNEYPANQRSPYDVAVQVLTACANGRQPCTGDIHFLKEHAMPREHEMEPAELAGAILWRIFKAKDGMDHAV